MTSHPHDRVAGRAGTLIGGAHAGITGRLDVFEAQLERAVEDEAEDVTGTSGARPTTSSRA